jgi:alpha-tubulin suppressor-like RCC1 family protein
MSFFQNVFDFEFRPTIFGADRQYQTGWSIKGNENRSDYMVSGNSGTFDLSAGAVLSLRYAFDPKCLNYASLDVTITGANSTAVTPSEICTSLNSNATFAEYFVASIYYPTQGTSVNKAKILIKGKVSRANWRAYVLNSGAEIALKFNKRAPVGELPSYFKKFDIAQRFQNQDLGADRLVLLNPDSPVDAQIIAEAGFNPKAPKSDSELLAGSNDAYWVYNKTYSGSNVATEIKYPAGAREGYLAKKTFYTYSGSNLIGVMETPYVLQTADILTTPPPSATLWGFGYNALGSLGDNTIVHRSSPVQTVAFGETWKQADGSLDHTAAIKTDGTLWTWGGNANGQLGDNTIVHRSSPVQTVAFGSSWAQVSCGYYQDAAIKTDGTLWMWGKNSNGQLGDNTITHRSSPVQTVAFGTNWSYVSVGYHVTAIKTDGTLWTWGLNSNGQLGDNTITHRSSPVQTVALGNNWFAVEAGAGHTVALKVNGTLWTWGNNANGQLGDNTIVHRSSPVQTVALGNDWMKIAAGKNFVAAIKTDSTLWTWGENTDGQLGDNTIVHRSSPVQTVAGGTNWSYIAAGKNSLAAVKTDGTLWAWGNNANGQLGDNTIVHRSSPVQTIALGTTWKIVSAGGMQTIVTKA